MALDPIQNSLFELHHLNFQSMTIISVFSITHGVESKMEWFDEASWKCTTRNVRYKRWVKETERC